jgi:hypothetical protein
MDSCQNDVQQVAHFIPEGYGLLSKRRSTGGTFYTRGLWTAVETAFNRWHILYQRVMDCCQDGVQQVAHFILEGYGLLSKQL